MTTKAQTNPYDDIFGKSESAPASVPKPKNQPTSTQSESEPPPKKEAAASDVKMSTYRLTESDYRLLKGLAARDGMKLNDIIYEALRQYCKGRGVELTGSV